MIRRKKLVKAITTMVILMIIFIICVLPVCAESYLNEVRILDDFVVQVLNPTEDSYTVTVNIMYQDVNGDSIYQKNVTKKIEAFETIKIDAKDYYNSKKIQKVVAEITREQMSEVLNEATNDAIAAGVFLVLAIVFTIIGERLDNEVWFFVAAACFVVMVLLLVIALLKYCVA